MGITLSLLIAATNKAHLPLVLDSLVMRPYTVPRQSIVYEFVTHRVLFFNHFFFTLTCAVSMVGSKGRRRVLYFMSCIQYLSSASFNLTTCSVVLMPHQVVTASCNCGPGSVF